MTDRVHEEVVSQAVDQTDPGTETSQLSDLETLRSQLDAAQAEAANNNDKYLRARAEMENFRRRMERNYADQALSSKKGLLLKLLSVKDNLQRALHYGEQQTINGEGLMEGVRLTDYQLDQILNQEGVKPIEAEGQPFDPRLEEAVHRVNDHNVPDHTVVQVVRPGYTLGDDVLRPAQVVVSVHEEQ